LNLTQGITIRPFQPTDQQEARNLVLAGLAEHWGTLDPHKNPDLENIGQSYAEGVFLVALLEQRIIATAALVFRPGDSAEIVRMSVAAGMRRCGIGSLMLDSLCAEARRWGIRRLVLETTQTWDEVVAFYQRYGFKITHYRDGDVYFEMDV
jgi:putative acetyltransferase